MSEYWTSFAKVLKLIKVCIKAWLSFNWIIEFAQKYSMSLINRLNLIWHFYWLSMMTSLSKFLTVLSSANTIDISLFEMSANSALYFMSFSSLFLMISKSYHTLHLLMDHSTCLDCHGHLLNLLCYRPIFSWFVWEYEQSLLVFFCSVSARSRAMITLPQTGFVEVESIVFVRPLQLRFLVVSSHQSEWLRNIQCLSVLHFQYLFGCWLKAEAGQGSFLAFHRFVEALVLSIFKSNWKLWIDFLRQVIPESAWIWFTSCLCTNIDP